MVFPEPRKPVIIVMGMGDMMDWKGRDEQVCVEGLSSIVAIL